MLRYTTYALRSVKQEDVRVCYFDGYVCIRIDNASHAYAVL